MIKKNGEHLQPQDLQIIPGGLPRHLEIVYVLVWATLTFLFAKLSPEFNWDIIAYTASAYEMSGLQGTVLRESTFEDVRRFVPEDVFQSLISEQNEYRFTVHQDALALQEQLPFYRIRYAYIWLVYAIGLLICSFAQATVMVSAAAGFLIVAFSGLLFSSKNSQLAFLAFPPLVMISGALSLARLSTPDAIAALAAILLFIALMSRHFFLAVGIVSLLPIVRTDYIILSLAVSLFLLLNKQRTIALSGAMLSLGAYYFVNHFAGNYGHAVIFNFTLIHGPHPFPLSMPISTDVQDYLTAYVRGLRILSSDKLLYITLYTAVLLVVANHQGISKNRFEVFFLISLSFVLIHFALFPAGFARTYFLLVWASLACLAEAYTIAKSSPRRPKFSDVSRST